MGKRVSGRNTQSVGWRFTGYTFALVLAVSVVFVGVEGYRSYRHEVTRLTRYISQIEESHVPSIVSSLWLTDYDLLNRQLDAIARFPYVARVEVIDVDETTHAAGTDARSDLSRRTQKLSYTRRGTSFDVGTMRLYIDQAAIRTVAFRAEVFSAAGHLAGAILSAGIVALLFRRLVGRHLERLAASAQAAPGSDTRAGFALERRKPQQDELDELAQALASMHGSLLGQVAERELLMRDAHHRIKNDLAFVTGLLSLHAHRSDSPDVVGALQDASQRVNVVAEIYQATYSGSSVDSVDLSGVTTRVVAGVQSRGLLQAEAVESDVESVEAPVRLSVAYGVVLNELLTNSVKYAARADSGPAIMVQLDAAQAPRTARLEVTDNGPGFPGPVLRGERLGYGLTIAKALIEQHSGTMTLENGSGARVTVIL